MEVCDENDQATRKYAGIHESQVGRTTDAGLHSQWLHPSSPRARTEADNLGEERTVEPWHDQREASISGAISGG